MDARRQATLGSDRWLKIHSKHGDAGDAQGIRQMRQSDTYVPTRRKPRAQPSSTVDSRHRMQLLHAYCWSKDKTQSSISTEADTVAFFPIKCMSSPSQKRYRIAWMRNARHHGHPVWVNPSYFSSTIVASTIVARKCTCEAISDLANLLDVQTSRCHTNGTSIVKRISSARSRERHGCHTAAQHHPA